MVSHSTAHSPQIHIATFPGRPITEAIQVRDAFIRALQEHHLDELGPLHVHLVGWHGIEGKDVVVKIHHAGTDSLYQLVTPDMVPKIVQRHLLDQLPIKEWLGQDEIEQFLQPQAVHSLEWCGRVDPLSRRDYQDQDGFSGLRFLRQCGFEAFLGKVRQSGLVEANRVREVSPATLWEESRAAADNPVLVLNGAPPTTLESPDLLLAEGCPYQVLEGLLIVTHILRSTAAVIYLPQSATLARERLQSAWQELVEADESDPLTAGVELLFLNGHQRFLNDDHELMTHTLRSDLPRQWLDRHAGSPWLVSSLQTAAALPPLAVQAVYGFQQLGSEWKTGSRVFRLAGPLQRTGFVELRTGTPLADVIDAVGAGTPKGKHLKAVRVGGPLGGMFPPDLLQLGLDHATLEGLGGTLSQAVIEALTTDQCIVSAVRDDLESILNHGVSHCPECSSRMAAILRILTDIVNGTTDPSALDQLQTACESAKREADCEIGRQAANAVFTSLQFFRSEYVRHTENKHCPARVCARLIPAPCQLACPTGIDIPSYLALLSQGHYREALDLIRQDNPFPWVCGLICPHPCERACVRANLDDPINIKYLKAFVAEQADRAGGYLPGEAAPDNGKQVAVIGSGPAGLSAAHYLALAGYRVTVFEAQPVAGGLLMTGIPEYRLPRQVVAKEIDTLRALGVRIQTGVTVGRDITLDELRSDGFQAFFLGIGAHQGYKLKIKGENDYPQVHDAITFLRQVNLGNRAQPADRVVVVGGGNAAMDAARTCVRLGCREVHIAYRRTREQMPAHQQEVEEALEEGVQFHFLAVPVEVGGTDGHVEYLECLQAQLGKPDASGRRRPIPVADSNFRIEAGAVITAIGQQPDFGQFGEHLPVQVTPRNLIVTSAYGTRTSVADIFAGGDAVTGPATVVEAIAAGKQAAMDIDHFLSGAAGPGEVFRVHKRRRISFTAVAAQDKIETGRPPMALADPATRSQSFDPVELGYTEQQALAEARRCLRCDVCIRCGTCERVCRDEMKVDALHFRQISTSERILGDYQHPGKTCITCGACALACPTGAIDAVEQNQEREIRLCGTVLNRLDVPRCSQCGRPFVPKRYLDYVNQRSDAAIRKFVLRKLCPQCARQQRASRFGQALLR